jgi:hypothetical protein
MTTNFTGFSYKSHTGHSEAVIIGEEYITLTSGGYDLDIAQADIPAIISALREAAYYLMETTA